MLLRSILCALVAFALLAAVSTAADPAKKKKKKNAAANTTVGDIVKVDAEKGTLTVKVAAKKKTFQEKEFKVTEKTAVSTKDGDKKVELKADKVAELLKKEQFKAGSTVTIEAEEDGTTAKTVTIGAAEAKKKKKKENK